MQWQTSTAPLIRRTTAELNHFHPQHPPQSMLPLMMPVAFQTAPSQAFSQQQAAGPLSVTIKQDQKAPLPKENLSPLVSTPMPFDPESPSDDDASTLSPSSFLLQQFTLPGCNDVTGTCACGDGCECPGCLTHSGHNREPGSQITDSLEHSSLSSAHEVDSFSLESDNHEEIFAPAVPG